MIIVRGTESQALPNSLATPQKEYAGEGIALANAGRNIASVSDRALQYSASLNDAQQRSHAANAMRKASNDYENGANDAFYTWNTDHVQKGELPASAVSTYQTQLDALEQQIGASYKGDLESNPYLAGGLPATLSDARTNALVKARAHANTQYVAIGREQVKTQIDVGDQLALQYDARGDKDGYYVQVGKNLSYIESARGAFYNDAETNALKQSYTTNIEAKQAAQWATRDPQGYLEAYDEKRLTHLDPKVAHDINENAEHALSRKVTMQDHTDRKQLEQIHEQQTVLKNEAISRAMTDPAGAMASLNTREMRIFMGSEYDNTMSTLRSMAADSGINDPHTIQVLENEIDSNPSQKTYGKLNAAIQNGMLKTDKFTSMSGRLTERIEKFKDKREDDRNKLINAGIDKRKKGFPVTGIMQFDNSARDAEVLFDLEASKALRDDPNANIDNVLDRLYTKHKQYTLDNFTESAQRVLDRFGAKSAAEVMELHKTKQVSDTEADMMLWLLRTGGGNASAPKPSTPGASKPAAPAGKAKKKGVF